MENWEPLQIRLVWYVLAGFVLGFTTSTLWEWLYFRQFRLRARAFGTHRLTVTAWGDKMSDALVKEVRVVPDGLEVNGSRSDWLEDGASGAVNIPPEAITGTATNAPHRSYRIVAINQATTTTYSTPRPMTRASVGVPDSDT